MKRVMVFGSFDGLHPGHVNFFQQAKKYGSFLIVSVATDKNVFKFKKKKPLFSQGERLHLVSACKLVNKAVLGAERDFYLEIKKYSPDVIALGYDQWASDRQVKKELDKVGLDKCEIVRLEPYRPEISKSTIVKKKSVDF